MPPLGQRLGDVVSSLSRHSEATTVGTGAGGGFPRCQGLQHTGVTQPRPSGAKPSSAPARAQPAPSFVPARRGESIMSSDGKKKKVFSWQGKL